MCHKNYVTWQAPLILNLSLSECPMDYICSSVLYVCVATWNIWAMCKPVSAYIDHCCNKLLYIKCVSWHTYVHIVSTLWNFMSLMHAIPYQLGTIQILIYLWKQGQFMDNYQLGNIWFNVYTGFVCAVVLFRVKWCKVLSRSHQHDYWSMW